MRITLYAYHWVDLDDLRFLSIDVLLLSLVTSVSRTKGADFFEMELRQVSRVEESERLPTSWDTEPGVSF